MTFRYKVKLSILVVGDLLVMGLAFSWAFLLRFGFEEATTQLLAIQPPELLLYPIVLLGTSYLFDVYDLVKHGSRKELLINISCAAVVAFLLLASIFYMYPPVTIGRGVLAILLLLFAALQFLWHVAYVHAVRHPALALNTLILGTDELALKLGELLSDTTPCYCDRLVGYVACDGIDESVMVPAGQIIGEGRDLLEIVQRWRVDKIVVALPTEQKTAHLLYLLLTSKFNSVEIVDGLVFYEQLTSKLLLNSRNISEELIYSHGFKCRTIMASLKMVIDFCLALVGLLLVLPVFPVVILLVKLDSPGPIFYLQSRVGQWGKEFKLYKFRSMPQNAEANTGAVWAQQNDPRIGAIGGFIRKWRIDEIPQFFNVLAGDMSFIGPRPERPEFVGRLETLIPCYEYRHFVKPGLTGWAQIKYPYGASVEDAREKLCYDLYYIKHASLVMDLLVIFETIKVVLFGRGR